jgi:hypothetical protein
VRTKVKPELDRNNRAVYRNRWWQYAEKRPELYSTIAALGIDSLLARARIANRHAIVEVSTQVVFNEKTVVFPVAFFDLLQSSVHEEWAREYSSTLKRDLQYTPSDCFETFPTASVSAFGPVGRDYQQARSSICRSRNQGLTQIYNDFHNPSVHSPDLSRLRELHCAMDRVVISAYRWDDLALGHGFHDTKHGRRFTVSSGARQQILDRLLELNHQRYAEEIAQGLHEDGTSKGKADTTAKRRKKTPNTSPLLEGA